MLVKIIGLNKEVNNWIKEASGGSRKAQRELYCRYSPMILSTCRQYVHDIPTAEDLMICVFMKIFDHIGQFQFKGSFEGWIKRIAVNESISFLRKKNTLVFEESIIENEIYFESPDESLLLEDLQSMIDQLPLGCKTVFNLYVIEGYTHEEIASLLHISKGTSKSQLAYARKSLQKLINHNSRYYHGKVSI